MQLAAPSLLIRPAGGRKTVRFRPHVPASEARKALVRHALRQERMVAIREEAQRKAVIVAPGAPTLILPRKSGPSAAGRRTVLWEPPGAGYGRVVRGKGTAGGADVVADPTPDLEDDFSTYPSTANMLADPRGIISEGEDSNPSQIVLDTGVGVTSLGLTKSMRYDYPDQHAAACGGYTVGRNYSLASNQTELWVELYVKFGPTWEIYPAEMDAVCGGGYNPDFKLLFGRMTIDSRFEMLWGNSINGNVVAGYPGNEPAYQGITQIASYLAAGNWVRIRHHWKYSTSAGIQKLWIDDTRFLNNTGISMPSGKGLLYGLALGRNRDPRPGVAQSMWWGRVRAWYGGNDPGWT